MKTSLLSFILLVIAYPSFSQYYYKDLVVTRQIFGQMQRMKAAGVKSVVLSSFEADGQPAEGFAGSQQLNSSYTQMTTSTQSVTGDSSMLVSYFNAEGVLVKTVDTTDGAGSTTQYIYLDNKKVSRIINTATSGGQAVEREEHVWEYGSEGKPIKMLRIKNNIDTTVINYVLDEKGNVAEENPVRNGVKLPSIFYYHDGENRLTDIVMYNARAGRLLPVYVFDYNELGLLNSMMVVPEGSDEYQKWYYSYNDDDLKVKEVCFNKKKQMLGRIEYNYSK